MPCIDLLPEDVAGPLINEILVRLGSEPYCPCHGSSLRTWLRRCCSWPQTTPASSPAPSS